MTSAFAFDLVVAVEAGAEVDRAAFGRRLAEAHYDRAGEGASLWLAAPNAGAIVEEAVTAAVEAGRHLLVVSADTLPSLDCVGRLLDAFDADPMIGFAVPRFAGAGGLFPLPAEPAPPEGGHPRALLPLLPELYLCPELPSAVVLVRRETLTGVRRVARPGSSLAAAVLALCIRGRRLGYRTAVVNRAVTPAPSPEAAYPALDAWEGAGVAADYPCHGIARSWFAALPAHRREAKLAGALGPEAARAPRLLLDLRGLTECHNGSSVAMRGLLDGLASLDSEWRIDVLVTPSGERWHRLTETYRNLRIVLDRPDGVYAVAVRCCQPWALSTVAELHACAPKVAVTFLDTIMWDIIYPCSSALAAELSATWEFCAAHLDAVLFISEYSRQRFHFRFPIRSEVRQLVSGLSFDPADYAGPPVEAPDPPAADLLVFGNDYDHKWLAGALDWLADAFPFATIVVLGMAEGTRPNVQALPSGQLSAEAVHRLYASVKVVCFPSFYEGFGLPILEGLAHGLPVVARRSALLEEIAAHYGGPGRLVPFDDPLSLVENVARCLAGEEVETLKLGTAMAAGERPRGWRDVAARVLRLAGDLAAERDPARHDARDAALRMLRPDGGPAA